MKFLVSVLFCFLMSFICFLSIKITYWMEKVDKKNR